MNCENEYAVDRRKKGDAKEYKICIVCKKQYSATNYYSHKKTQYHMQIKKMKTMMEMWRLRQEKVMDEDANPLEETTEEWEENLFASIHL